MGSMAGTFTIPEFNSSYTISDSNLVRIGDKKFLEKKTCTPPFYLIFTSENHLNAHSSLIKPHMAMNVAPLDCSCLDASSEPKKIYLDFSVLEKFAKNQKIHIFGSHSKKWVQWPELLLYLNSTHPIQYLTAIWFESATKNFWKKTMYSPLLSNFHFGKSFKRP
jgi:hypothetical protein